MTTAFSSALLLKGLILGWSVAWPPGPINTEMIRRGLLPLSQGGGFWSAWRVGLGACAGDFLWALGVSAGAGAIMNTPRVRLILGVVSLVLLFFLAGVFALGAWRTARGQRAKSADDLNAKKRRLRMPGFLLGFTVVLMSPWNVGFWLAIIGSQSGQITGNLIESVFLASAVVCGALCWGCVLSLAVKLGAHIFSRPAWQVGTQALSALVMIYFAVQLVRQLAA